MLDNCCFELNFEKLFLDELRFLENKQQPNFYTSTMNLGVEKIVKEKLVVREQTFTNQESKSNMHDTNNTYLPLPQKSLNTPECLEFQHIVDYIMLNLFKIRGRIFSNKVGFNVEHELFMLNISFYIVYFVYFRIIKRIYSSLI